MLATSVNMFSETLTMPEDRIDSPGVKLPPPLLFAGALALGLIIGKRFPLRLRRPRTRVPGALLVGGGAGLVVWTRLLFLRLGTSIIPTRPATVFVASGPFRISRNPIYVGLTAIYVGTSLLRRSACPLLLLPAVIVTLQKTAIDREEAYLERRFGEEYLDYKASVRRWL